MWNWNVNEIYFKCDELPIESLSFRINFFGCMFKTFSKCPPVSGIGYRPVLDGFGSHQT